MMPSLDADGWHRRPSSEAFACRRERVGRNDRTPDLADILS